MSETLSDLLREKIKSSIDSGEDLTQPSNRTLFLKKFIEDHKDNKNIPDDIKAIRPTANRMFEEQIGKDNLVKQSHKSTKYNKKLASEIAAKTSEKKSGIKDEKKKDDKKEGDQNVTENKTQTTLQKKEGEGIKEPVYEHWTAVGVGAVFDAMLTPLRVAWPETPPLSEETKQALGEMWLPAFQRYGDEKLQFLIFPAIGTIGILAPVVVEGRKKHKETEEKKKKKKEDDKATEEEKNRIRGLTCPYCNEIFDSAHINSHKLTCPKKK